MRGTKRPAKPSKKAPQMDPGNVISGAGQLPVHKALDRILKKAIDERASDVHIEPFSRKVTVRFRIDGVLHELPSISKKIYESLILRIKILSGVGIPQSKTLQGGSFQISHQGRKIDLRVSVIPTIFGEKLVMRIRENRSDLHDLNHLGLESGQLQHFRDVLSLAHGLVLMAGPSGSGKSVTLYAVLNHILSSKANVVTIEDPVECRISGINQIQVEPEIGLTFASGLRAFLRQDPDAMLVGGIQDLETAEACIRASHTGHLVLSAFYADDAVKAVTGLLDMGVRPYLLCESLALVAAQRLVRLLCPHCKKAYRPADKLRKEHSIKAKNIFRAKGCPKCYGTGYYGRTAVYEILPVDEDVRSALVKGAGDEELRKLQREKKCRTLFQNGIRKVEAGLTDLEEISRVFLK